MDMDSEVSDSQGKEEKKNLKNRGYQFVLKAKYMQVCVTLDSFTSFIHPKAFYVVRKWTIGGREMNS